MHGFGWLAVWQPSIAAAGLVVGLMAIGLTAGKIVKGFSTAFSSKIARQACLAQF